MQVFKSFFLNTKKQMPSFVIYFFIFAVLALIFANNGSSTTGDVYKNTKMKIAVIDHDQTVLSKNLYEFIKENHTIVTIEDNKEKMADEIFYENVDYILIVPSGFEQGLLDGKTTGLLQNIKKSGSASGYFGDSQIEQYLSTIHTYLASDYSKEDAARLSLETSKQSAKVSMQSGKEDDSKSTLYYFFCYMPYLLVCIEIVGLGRILIVFRREELNARITCSSMSTTSRNLQLASASLIFSVLCWAAFVALSFFLNDATITLAQTGLYLLNSFVFLLNAASITFLLSYFTKKTDTLNMLANVLGLGLSFLGGIFVPLEYLSDNVLAIAHFLPSYWYVNANTITDSFTGNRAKLQEYFGYVGIEFLFAAALFAAALAASKFKRQSY